VNIIVVETWKATVSVVQQNIDERSYSLADM